MLTLWLLTLAIQRRSWRFLVAAAVVIGLNFDVKLIEATLPAFAFLVYFMIGSDVPFKRRIGLVAIAGAIAVVVALVWPVAISLAPANQRPYAMGSTNGSIWNAMFVFNGTKRVGIGSAGPGGANNWHNARAATRMFQTKPRQLGEYVGVALIATILFGFAALLLAGNEMLRGPPSDELRLRRAAFAMTTTWLVTVGLALSVSTRLHPRYVESLTPAISIALGVSVAWLAQATATQALRRDGDDRDLLRGHDVFRIDPSDHASSGLVDDGDRIRPRRAPRRHSRPEVRRAATGRRHELDRRDRRVLMIAVLASPFAVSQRLIAASYTDSSYGPTDISGRQAAHAATFFAAHRGGARYQAIVRTPSQASALIVRNGLPVLMLQTVGRGEIATVPARSSERSPRDKFTTRLLGRRCSGAHLRGLCPSTANWIAATGADQTFDRAVWTCDVRDDPTSRRKKSEEQMDSS